VTSPTRRLTTTWTFYRRNRIRRYYKLFHRANVALSYIYTTYFLQSNKWERSYYKNLGDRVHALHTRVKYTGLHLHVKIRIRTIVIPWDFPFKIITNEQFLIKFTTMLFQMLTKLLNAWSLNRRKSIFTCFISCSFNRKYVRGLSGKFCDNPFYCCVFIGRVLVHMFEQYIIHLLFGSVTYDLSVNLQVFESG
jgi:hypothetical protein